MTRTEDRLTDALRARADGIRDETLPPLLAPAPRRRHWARTLAPVAAAIAVALAVALPLALPSGRHATWFTNTAASGPPPYYVSQDSHWDVEVRSTATGAVTGSLPAPDDPGGGSMYPTTEASGPGGIFYVMYETADMSGPVTVRTKLLSFHLTRRGAVTGIAAVSAGTLLNEVPASAMSVSPDGSQIALATWKSTGVAAPAGPVGITVINLGAGTHHLWSGGLTHQGQTTYVEDVAWSDNSSLYFTAEWCSKPRAPFCGSTHADSQVRVLPVAGDGGRLGQSHGLAQAQVPAGPLAVVPIPGQRALAVLTLTSPVIDGFMQGLTVYQVPLDGSTPVKRLFHTQGKIGSAADLFLTGDATGRYLLFSAGQNGWIDHGSLKLLPVQRHTFDDVW